MSLGWKLAILCPIFSPRHCRSRVGDASMTAALIGVVSGDIMYPPPPFLGYVTARGPPSVHTEAGGGLSSGSLLPAGPSVSPVAIFAHSPLPPFAMVSQMRAVSTPC